MLEKRVSYDHTVTESGCILVRQITRIFEDGVAISETYHRHVVAPGDDRTNEDDRTRQIAGVVHTQAVVDAYKAKK